MEDIKLSPANLISIRSKCLEKVVELIKDDKGKVNADFGIFGFQDLKVQLIDCAGALTEFVINGKSAVSIVGKTPLLLSTSRALVDRKMTIRVFEFNALMIEKGYMDSLGLLTERGSKFGENKPLPSQWAGKSVKPYYYDDKFDELLELIGLKPKIKKG